VSSAMLRVWEWWHYITSFWVMGLRLYVVVMCRSRVEMGFRSERSTETRWAQVVVLLVVLLAILGKSLLVVCHYCEMFMLWCPGKLGTARNGGARDLDKQGDDKTSNCVPDYM